MRRPTGALGAIVIASAIVASCSTAEAPAPAARAPEPAPLGALYGRVMTVDGRAVPRAAVGLWQAELLDAARAFAAMATLGFVCLLPDHAACLRDYEISTADDGTFHFPPERMKDASTTILTATDYQDDVRSIPATTRAVFPDGGDPQRAPDLVLWKPRARFEATGRSVRVAWDANTPSPFAAATEYTVDLVESGRPRTEARVGGPTTAPFVDIDSRALEDGAALLVIRATTAAPYAGGEVHLSYTSHGIRVPAGLSPTPLSRGRGCLADDGAASGQLAEALSPCPLTDGDLHTHAAVLLPGECSITTHAGCGAESRHRRLCVDLAGAHAVSLVIVRTPSPSEFIVTLEVDRQRHGSPVRPRPDDETTTTREDFQIVVDPPRRASVVCVEREPSPSRPPEFVGANLSEISVW